MRVWATIALGVVNIAAAILVPLYLSLSPTKVYSEAESTIVGILTFIAFTVVEVAFVARRALTTELRFTAIWESREEQDRRLQEIRRLYHQVLESESLPEKDLYVRYFRKKLQDLENALRDANSKQEIRIDETMFEVTTWLLDASMDGSSSAIFRAIHFPEDNQFFRDVHTRRYFHQVFERVTKSQAKGVKRIIVYDDSAQLTEEFTQRLMRFHQAANGYACKTLHLTDFRRIVQDYALDLVRDFGIFGEKYLYRGIVTTSDQIIGMYSKDPREIKRYTDFFEMCWSAAADPSIVIMQSESATLEWLFETSSRA